MCRCMYVNIYAYVYTVYSLYSVLLYNENLDTRNKSSNPIPKMAYSIKIYLSTTALVPPYNEDLRSLKVVSKMLVTS